MKNTTNISNEELMININKTKEFRSSNLEKFKSFASKYTKSDKLKDVWKAFNRA
jgi:hypothetical protein